MQSHGSLRERPEIDLLLLCARTKLSEDTRRRFDARLAGPIDWDMLLGLAARHGLTYLVYRALKTTDSAAVPGRVMTEMQRRFLAGAARSHRAVHQLLRVIELLESNRVPVVAFKGPALASLVYGDEALRQFSDLDILVRPENVFTARDLLAELGYFYYLPAAEHAQEALIRYQMHFVMKSERGELPLEIHWKTEPGRPMAGFSEEIWNRIGRMNLADREIRRFSIEDLLMYLCIHGSTHSWARLAWVCDVAETVRRFETIDWDAVLRRTQKLKRLRMLFLGLTLAADLLDAPVPRSIEQRMRAYPGVRDLAALVKEAVGDVASHGQTLESSFSFRFKARESVRDRLSFALERFFAPDPNDFAWAKVPSSLYPLLRPVRLLTIHLPQRLKRRQPPRTEQLSPMTDEKTE